MFFQLPHGLLAVSLMTTFVPDLAGPRPRRLAGFHERLLLGLRLLVAGRHARRRSATWSSRPPLGGAGRGERPARRRRRRCRSRRILGGFALGPPRLLRRTCSCCRVLRPEGHPDAVLRQLRRERASTSSSRSLLVRLASGVVGPGRGLRDRLLGRRGGRPRRADPPRPGLRPGRRWSRVGGRRSWLAVASLMAAAVAVVGRPLAADRRPRADRRRGRGRRRAVGVPSPTWARSSSLRRAAARWGSAWPPAHRGTPVAEPVGSAA